MTRPSKRELERRFDDLDDTDDSTPSEVVIEDTVIGTPWPSSDLDDGEERTTTTEIEL